MNILSKGLKQDATWWASTSDAFGGFTFGAPVSVKVRWEDRNEVFVGPLDKSERVSAAVVYLDRDVGLFDYLYLGVSVASDPTAVAGARKVERFDKIPDLRNLQVMRKAFL